MIDERLRRIAGRARTQHAAKPIGFPTPGLGTNSLDARLQAVRDQITEPPLVIMRNPSLRDQREAFFALSEEEQTEQVELHLASVNLDGAIRPRFSDLLYAMGIVPPDA